MKSIEEIVKAYYLESEGERQFKKNIMDSIALAFENKGNTYFGNRLVVKGLDGEAWQLDIKVQPIGGHKTTQERE
jgi:hypothetical protein